jgi:hypothetical protein
MRLVLVEWIDSNGAPRWTDYDEMLRTVKEQDLGCKTVGWLLLDVPERISLAGSVSGAGSVSDTTTIPRVAILSITDLGVPLSITPDAGAP